MIWFVSSETILTAKNPGSSAGWRAISSMRDLRSARVADAKFGSGKERDPVGALSGWIGRDEAEGSAGTTVRGRCWSCAEMEERCSVAALEVTSKRMMNRLNMVIESSLEFLAH